MFSKDFMDELLKPQQLYSHRTLKTVLSRLAHASIMRLSLASMDRLYELMVMAFKYQVFLCPRPKDLLLITYNHMDAIRQRVGHTPVVVNQVDETHRKIIEVYSSLSEGEFQLLRQTLLIFFQDMHVRVSPRSLIAPDKMFDRKGREVTRGEFPSGGSYTSPIREGCFELHGDRVIALGTNMYKDNAPNLLAKEELNLLARLMGSMKADITADTETGFRINLFTSDQEEEDAGASGGAEQSLFGVINIQAMQDEQAATQLARIAGQFAEGAETPAELGGSKGDDLLAMMDDL
ncbi:Protein OSCP1 [Liparis tanakae]|uniref:Protein OSCP1 n=1 Tax=Liparis tanakae TaxID=230148 RepID=A0A4Z2GXQ9_9TELE|nr:Protein OSCP1 [Liparis tanakae]